MLNRSSKTTGNCPTVFPLEKLFGFAGEELTCNDCWESHNRHALLAAHRSTRPELAQVLDGIKQVDDRVRTVGENIDHRVDDVGRKVDSLSNQLLAVPAELLNDIDARLGPAMASGEFFTRLDSIEDTLKRIVAQANDHLLRLLANSDDLAARGPRLITVSVTDPHLLKKGWKSANISLYLWCEHSMRRLDELTRDPKGGVYTIEVTRASLQKLVPLVSVITRLLVGVAPLGALTAEHNLDPDAFAKVQHELKIGEASLGATKTALGIGETKLGDATPIDADAALSVAELKIAQDHIAGVDPHFGGLVAVRDRQTLVRHWVHDIYANLAVVALHAGDMKENAEHIHDLVAQDTLATAEEHLVSQRLTHALDHLNKALKELTATKIVLRSTGAS